jgi:hypothetical protein
MWQVNTGNPKDRVYLLQYTGSSRRMFYWMQVRFRFLVEFTMH